MRTINDNVCTAPFPFTGVQVETRASGLKQVMNYAGLVALKVLADDGNGILKGDVVYVSGKDVKSPWGLARFKLESGEDCIFVPRTSIYLLEEKVLRWDYWDYAKAAKDLWHLWHLPIPVPVVHTGGGTYTGELSPKQTSTVGVLAVEPKWTSNPDSSGFGIVGSSGASTDLTPKK